MGGTGPDTARAADGAAGVTGGRPTAGRDLRARGQRTLQRLLAAGPEVFRSRGYHATRVDDIARAARTSHGTFYLYFSSKDDLLAVLLEQCFEDHEQLVTALDELPRDGDDRRALDGWLHRYAELQQRHGPVLRAWHEAGDGATASAATGRRRVRQFHEALAERIARIVGGRLEPRVATLALTAMMERMPQLTRALHDEVDWDVTIATVAQILHAGVFAGDGAQAR